MSQFLARSSEASEVRVRQEHVEGRSVCKVEGMAGGVLIRAITLLHGFVRNSSSFRHVP